MLTGPRVLGSRFGPARRRALALGWRPCTRGLPLPTLAGVAALAALPSLVVLARHGRSYDGALVVAALALGAASAFAVDDPAEETLSTSPTPLALRRLLRLGSIVLGVALTSAVLVLVAAVSTPGGVAWADVARRGAELGVPTPVNRTLHALVKLLEEAE
jgi:hypothetical protein